MASIKQDMIHGLFWSTIEKYSGLIIGIILSMVLARLISPSEYGVVAIASVLISFLSIFSTMGIGPAIIQREDLNQQDFDNIFTFTICVGGFLGILFFCLSWLIASFYENDILIPICQILSINLFFGAANMVPNALMAKNKRFKEIAKRTLILQFLTGILAILTAYLGCGIFSLLIPPVLTTIGIYFYNKLFYPVHLSKHFSLESVKKIFSFSIYQLSFEVINYFSRNADKLIIGKTLPIAELGYYDKSYSLMKMPMNNVTAVINPVLQPVMVILQDDLKQMAEKYNSIIKFIATISFPLGITLYYCGSEVIRIMYGDKWIEAISCFEILALSLPIQMILSTVGGMFQASNSTDHMFYAGLRNSFITIVALLISVFCFGTIESVAWSWTISIYICFLSSYIDLYVFVFHSSFWQMLKVFLLPLFVIPILIFEFELIKRIDIQYDIYSLLIKLSVAFVTTMIYVQLTGLYDIIGIIKKRFNANTNFL